MNRRNRLPAVGVCLLLASLPLKAQHDAYLSVDDALEMAVRNNKNIRMAELEHKMANADFHQTDAVFLPQLSVGYQVEKPLYFDPFGQTGLPTLAII